MGEENGEAEGEPSAKKHKSSSGQLNQFIFGLAGVLEGRLTSTDLKNKTNLIFLVSVFHLHSKKYRKTRKDKKKKKKNCNIVAKRMQHVGFNSVG